MSPEHMQRLHEIHLRMMADPVIRDRVATDPVLQRMLVEMDMAMMMPPTATAGGGDAAPGDAEQAMDFIVRLLSDPEVEARIHADPRLHQLWSDPEVQRRLEEMRREPPTEPGQMTAPTAPVAPAATHQHQ